ncbi:hypothetical protein BOTBODRAFT_189607 [Botryobasidium botryosum FD-172 SS1]|uniref:DUF6533 domain-containing protein n=1 Tax=Botryobasidium botryosum (strain FD-172 SS1) TaxID=930990 RepID=A0A067MAN5_BOTB1|nr:hypothetical protein BOTBODRAFT_189607 [Botryobasidium botryosum FD-172 SS1]
MDDTSKILSYLGYNDEVAYIVASSTVVLLYDLALTFEREIRLVWRAPWNLAKGLFLFVSIYLTVSFGSHALRKINGPAALFLPALPHSHGHHSRVMLLSYPSSLSILNLACPPDTALQATSDVRTSCLIFSAIFTITANICECIVDLLMLIRVCAIWGRSFRVLVFMGALYAITNILSGIADIEYLATMRKYVMSNDSCFRSRASPLIYVCWSSALAYDTAAFLLTLTKGIQHWRAKHIRSPLIYVFYRDGVGYFAVLTLLRILTIIGSTVENLGLFIVATYFARVLTVTLTMRMFLNLRSATTHEEWSMATTMWYAAKPSKSTTDGVA